MTAGTPETPEPYRVRAYLPGNPDTWTPGQHTRHERMLHFMDMLREQGTLTDAARAANIDPTTVWEWRSTYPDFAAAVSQFLTRDRQAAIEDNLYRIATSTDPKTANAAVKASEFYLKALDRPRYGDMLTTTSTIEVTHQLAVIQDHRAVIQRKQQERLHALRTIDEEPTP